MGRVYRAATPTATRPRSRSSRPRSPATTSSAGASTARPRSRSGSTTRTSSRSSRRARYDGLPYLAQAFIAGGSLEDRIKREGHAAARPTPCGSAPPWPAGSTRCTPQGLIHRDVKPGEHPARRGGHAVHRRLRAGQGPRRQRADRRPARRSGRWTTWRPSRSAARRCSAQSDVYALGCVMFECLSGKPPFADRQGMRILWAHLQEEPPDPLAERDDVPEPTSAWALTRALQKEPEDRPPTATAYASMVRIAARGMTRDWGSGRRLHVRREAADGRPRARARRRTPRSAARAATSSCPTRRSRAATRRCALTARVRRSRTSGRPTARS